MSTATRPTIYRSSAKPSLIAKLAGSSTASVNRDDQVEQLAIELLEQHHHFRGRYQQVEFRCEKDRLILGGCLPSYYLKQLAQEAIREIEGVQIINQISVSETIQRGVPHPQHCLNSAKTIPKPR